MSKSIAELAADLAAALETDMEEGQLAARADALQSEAAALRDQIREASRASYGKGPEAGVPALPTPELEAIEAELQTIQDKQKAFLAARKLAEGAK
jgi:hypothetical protein